MDQEFDVVLNEGESLVRRIQDATNSIRDVTATYRKWINILQALPANLEGTPEEIARHFLHLGR